MVNKWSCEQMITRTNFGEQMTCNFRNDRNIYAKLDENISTSFRGYIKNLKISFNSGFNWFFVQRRQGFPGRFIILLIADMNELFPPRLQTALHCFANFAIVFQAIPLVPSRFWHFVETLDYLITFKSIMLLYFMDLIERENFKFYKFPKKLM